jgi:hypothetical protein
MDKFTQAVISRTRRIAAKQKRGRDLDERFLKGEEGPYDRLDMEQFGREASYDMVT